MKEKEKIKENERPNPDPDANLTRKKVLKEAFGRESAPPGIKPTPEEIAKLEKYEELLRKRRNWAMLVSRNCAEDPWTAILESVNVFRILDQCQEMEIVDIGSGGGLLGVVLAVLAPRWKIVLAESSRRKCAFLAETIGVLRTKNAEVFPGTVQELAREREFDCAVSRSFGKLQESVPLAMALVRQGGRYVALKGCDRLAELEELACLSGVRIEKSLRCDWPEKVDRGPLSLVVIRRM